MNKSVLGCPLSTFRTGAEGGNRRRRRAVRTGWVSFETPFAPTRTSRSGIVPWIRSESSTEMPMNSNVSVRGSPGCRCRSIQTAAASTGSPFGVSEVPFGGEADGAPASSLRPSRRAETGGSRGPDGATPATVETDVTGAQMCSQGGG